MQYNIPVTWQSFGMVVVEAKSLKQAIKKFDETKDNIGLPEGEYVEASFDREDEESCKFHNTDVKWPKKQS